MTTTKHEALLRDIVREVQPVVASPSRRPGPIDPTYTVIIGTSGSTDYLDDTTGNKRLWPVSVQGGVVAADDGQICDGLHDEVAPTQYLCSRCFLAPRGDLAESQDDEYDDARRDEDEEME